MIIYLFLCLKNIFNFFKLFFYDFEGCADIKNKFKKIKKLLLYISK
jgi:hypothetical protein